MEVKCRHSIGQSLTKGKIYSVIKELDFPPLPKILFVLNDKGVETGYLESRFVLVSENVVVVDFRRKEVL